MVRPKCVTVPETPLHGALLPVLGGQLALERGTPHPENYLSTPKIIITIVGFYPLLGFFLESEPHHVSKLNPPMIAHCPFTGHFKYLFKGQHFVKINFYFSKWHLS